MNRKDSNKPKQTQYEKQILWRLRSRARYADPVKREQMLSRRRKDNKSYIINKMLEAIKEENK